MARHLHFCRRRGVGKWRYLRRSPDYETLYKPPLLMGKQNVQPWPCFYQPGVMKVWTDKSDTPVQLPVDSPPVLVEAIG